MTTKSGKSERVDVAIVGAGLGGLATAARLGRAGLRVAVCERAPVAGGRGRTVERSGFSLNLGPHAIYEAGPAAELLRSLDVPLPGRRPSGQGVIVREGKEHAIPASPLTMLSTSALDLRGKFELMRLFSRIGRLSGAGLEGMSAQAWIAEQVPGEVLQALVRAFVRIATYCDELDVLSADAAVVQLQLALRGVLYLDGGWQRIVDALVQRCVAAGVQLRTDARVDAVGRADTARWAVELADGTIRCEHLIVAGSPKLADSLLGPVLGGPRFAAGTRPVTAACLDLGLRGAWPGPGLVFNLDEPIYLSVHSAVANLAPREHTLVSLAWYRRACDADTPAAELRTRLERSAQRWMPDYRSAVVVEQFLPEMIVAHDLPQADRGGLPGRPSATLGDGLYIVGDWVGERGQLLDAALASATTVCDAVLASADSRAVSPRPRAVAMAQ